MTQVRIYYEDTDAAGVVYHTGYLRFFERGRTEYLRALGCSVAELARNGAVFPVIRMEVDFRAAARHDELLEITTIPVQVGRSSLTFKQQAVRESDGKLLVDVLVTLACTGPGGRARRIPDEVRLILQRQLSVE